MALPDFTAQSGSAYKTNIDGTFAEIADGAGNVLVALDQFVNFVDGSAGFRRTVTGGNFFDMFAFAGTNRFLRFGFWSSGTFTPAMVVQSINLNVGIGVALPQAPLHVEGSAVGAFTPALRLTNKAGVSGGASGQTTGILFDVEAGNNRAKGGIAFEDTASWGMGTLHFLNNNVVGDTDATLADSKMSIDSVGDVTVEQALTAASIEVGDSGDRTAFKVKIIDIGDWDMDATANVQIAHGLTAANIRSITVFIREDTGLGNNVFALDFYNDIVGQSLGGYDWDDTNVNLNRAAGIGFDGTDYNATSYNRGWITIIYT